jgi:hypothetical protein
MRTGTAGYRPDEVAGYDEALLFTCSFCHAARGQQCTYTSRYRKVDGEYVFGKPCQKPHRQRQEKARIRRQQERYRDGRPVVPASRTQREAAAALRAFDLAEYEQLRDWLKNFGPILWEPARPGGSLRGESCAIGWRPA